VKYRPSGNPINNLNEIRANRDYFSQIWVKLKMFPQIGKIWVNSNRLNQLWPNNNSSIQIRAMWNIETSGQIGRVSFRFASIINISSNYNSPNQNWANWNNFIQIWAELETF